jgi:hypothetical protein
MIQQSAESRMPCYKNTGGFVVEEASLIYPGILNTLRIYPSDVVTECSSSLNPFFVTIF